MKDFPCPLDYTRKKVTKQCEDLTASWDTRGSILKITSLIQMREGLYENEKSVNCFPAIRI